MATQDNDDPASGPSDVTKPAVLRRGLEMARYLVAGGSLTVLIVCAATFVWAGIKAVRFVQAAASSASLSKGALVYLFECIDTILIGVVLLQVGLGLWELCVGDLALPESLTAHTFDGLEAKVASTLVLVLVVRFLEVLVQSPSPETLVATAVSVSLIGGLLVVFARWRL